MVPSSLKRFIEKTAFIVLYVYPDGQNLPYRLVKNCQQAVLYS